MKSEADKKKYYARRRNLIGLFILSVVVWSGFIYYDGDQGYFAGDQGYFGPVPTGEPNDPFDITSIEGDGWRMWDSGRGLLSGASPFIWTGDKQVFFRGLNSPQFKSREDEKQNKHKMKSSFYYWDLDQGIRPVKAIPSKRNYCFNKGWLNWFGATNPNISVKVISGRVVEERPVQKYQKAKPGKFNFYNHYNCKREIQTKGLFPGLTSRALRRGDGHLVYKLGTVGSKPIPVKLVNPDQSLNVELPFTNYDVTSSCARYIEFKQAYFVFNCILGGDPNDIRVKKWKAENCLSAWWLWSSGKTERLCIPYGPWAIGGTWSVMPLVNGLFITTIHYESRSKAGQAGGYLFRRNELEKIVTGMLQIASHNQNVISADGCRVAFGYAPTPKTQSRIGKGKITTRILDVCVDATE